MASQTQERTSVEIVHSMPLEKAKGLLVDMADGKRFAAERARRDLRKGLARPQDARHTRLLAETMENEAWAIQRVLRALQEANERIAELEGSK